VRTKAFREEEGTSMGRVSDKVAVVTGGGAGIGRAASLLLAKEGAKVAVLDIDDQAGRQTVAEIKAAGGDGEYWHTDVREGVSIAATFAEVESRFGKIQVLVNNAGVMGIQRPTDQIEEGEWQRIIDIDLKGVFLCTKYVVPYLRKAGGGSIINLSSILGLVGGGDPPYHAAKGGVRLMTKSDAYYYGKENIRVNSIHPGYILTPMVESMIPDDPDEAKKFRAGLDGLTLLGHIGEPDDVAYAILYLASEESKFVTGSELTVDGGYTSV
jgi:NAD(P)-dependent dehydrogenase (short-subunit alcohol dehydrogenase family)